MGHRSAPSDESLLDKKSYAISEGHGKFRPRTGLLRTIGSELISSEVVAVIELVRNCYDADATVVEISFDAPEDENLAVIEIRDNGHGMSKDTLLGPWFEPATDHKSNGSQGALSGSRSPRGRRRLGSKGVGRFATQRLGNTLEVRTRTARMQSELIARFDWLALEENAYLDEVRIPWQEVVPHHVDPCGTHLHIADLRDRWTSDRFDRLRLGLARLVSPGAHEDFIIRVVINGAAEVVTPAIDVQQAMYSIHGGVDDEGNAEIRYADVNGDVEVWRRSLYWPKGRGQQCGPFSFRINAWDLDRGPLEMFLRKTESRLGLRDFRRLIRDHSGISLYRDGFRILPYGESDNDWLRLDSRRVNNPTLRLSNNQVLGSLEFTADANPELRDQTNREGLVANDAYVHLTEVVRELLGYLETRRFAARRAMDVDWNRNASALPRLHDDRAGSELDALIDKLARRDGDGAGVAKLIRRRFAAFRDSTADAVRHYAGLATAGQMSSLVVSQLRHPIRQAKSELALAADDLGSTALGPDDMDDLRTSLNSALQHLSTIEKRLDTLNPLAVGGRGRRLSLFNVADAAEEVVAAFKAEADRTGVSLSIRGDGEAEVRANREILQQVLANLVDNAMWFASQGGATSPLICIEVLSDGLLVSDNGAGVPKHLEETIFEPHFTTRDDAYGLGLTLSRDLLKTIGGRLALVSNVPATFRVSYGE